MFFFGRQAGSALFQTLVAQIISRRRVCASSSGPRSALANGNVLYPASFHCLLGFNTPFQILLFCSRSNVRVLVEPVGEISTTFMLHQRERERWREKKKSEGTLKVRQMRFQIAALPSLPGVFPWQTVEILASLRHGDPPPVRPVPLSVLQTSGCVEPFLLACCT